MDRRNVNSASVINGGVSFHLGPGLFFTISTDSFLLFISGMTELDEVNVECTNGTVQIAFTDETASDIPKNHDLIGKILTKARRSRGTY